MYAPTFTEPAIYNVISKLFHVRTFAWLRLITQSPIPTHRLPKYLFKHS